MKKVLLNGLFFSLATIFVAGCQVSPTVHGRGSVVIHDDNSRVGMVFSTSDHRHIHDYYRDHYHYYQGRKRLPPGLAKRDRLPPGLSKRDRLPHGLYGYRLPHELDRRLSRLPDGVIRVRIGTSIVLIDEQTRVVLDIIKDIPFY